MCTLVKVDARHLFEKYCKEQTPEPKQKKLLSSNLYEIGLRWVVWTIKPKSTKLDTIRSTDNGFTYNDTQTYINMINIHIIYTLTESLFICNTIYSNHFINILGPSFCHINVCSAVHSPLSISLYKICPQTFLDSCNKAT